MNKQIGGDNDLSDIKLWNQDNLPPSSYKIQIGYVEIPKTIKLDEKWLDTPYRFKSFSDANQQAQQIFDGYQFRIVSSNDQPYWDAPSYLHIPMDSIKRNSWSDIVGVKPITQTLPTTSAPLPPVQQYAYQQLAKLRNPIQSALPIPSITASTLPRPIPPIKTPTLPKPIIPTTTAPVTSPTTTMARPSSK